MRAVDDILERVKQLTAADQKELVDRISRLVAPPPAKPRGRYKTWLEAAGTIRSDYSDLASNKYKHVAAAAADEPDEP